MNACQPGAIAAYAEWLIKESGWKVRSESSELTPISARHICILFRRFTNWGVDITREYVKALEARDVPHLLVGSKSFHAREEVQTLRAAMAAIEWPEDELSVYATFADRCSRFPIALYCAGDLKSDVCIHSANRKARWTSR